MNPAESVVIIRREGRVESAVPETLRKTKFTSVPEKVICLRTRTRVRKDSPTIQKLFRTIRKFSRVNRSVTETVLKR